jgi:hypothetical protein
VNSLHSAQNISMFKDMLKNFHPSIILLVVVVAVILLFRWRRRQSRAKHNLERNQRAVYLQRQWLDPVVELIVVGGVIWNDLQHGWLPWLALIVGAVIGLPIGAIRGRFMYVRSLGKGSKVVLERNAAEIGILAALIAIKLAARAVSADPTSAINLVAVALLGVGIASSVGRVVFITIRHYQSLRSMADLPPQH